MKQYKERIYYIKDTSTGKTVYCGKSANYPSICSTGKTLEELEKSSKEQMQLISKLLQKAINTPDSIELVEASDEDSWMHLDVNSTYWEIKRLQYLLTNNKEFRGVLIHTITDALMSISDSDMEQMSSPEIASMIIKEIQSERYERQ